MDSFAHHAFRKQRRCAKSLDLVRELGRVLVGDFISGKRCNSGYSIGTLGIRGEPTNEFVLSMMKFKSSALSTNLKMFQNQLNMAYGNGWQIELRQLAICSSFCGQLRRELCRLRCRSPGGQSALRAAQLSARIAGLRTDGQLRRELRRELRRILHFAPRNTFLMPDMTMFS